MRKIKVYWLMAKEWLVEKYTGDKVTDLLIMVGIGLCIAGILSVIFF